jgi:pSer/pThr/pTyr-binding forkhead associated (FHA) protein
MNIRLLVQGRGRTKQIFHLEHREVILGRAEGVGVRIPSPEVSRRHCRLLLEDGLVAVEDLDSVNGTLLNGVEVVGKQLVQPGDQVSVGPVTFVVEYEMISAVRMDLEENDDLEVLESEDASPLEMEMSDEHETTHRRDPLGVGRDHGTWDEEEPLDVIEVPEEAQLEPFDPEEDWQPPAEEELRDMLSQMEEE